MMPDDLKKILEAFGNRHWKLGFYCKQKRSCLNECPLFHACPGAWPKNFRDSVYSRLGSDYVLFQMTHGLSFRQDTFHREGSEDVVTVRF